MFRAILTAWGCALLLFTCGLEEMPFLPPPVMMSPSSNTFIFKTPDFSNLTGDELATFRGIEIYYKFYKIGTDIPEQERNISTFNDLVYTYRFQRVASEGDKVANLDIPLIAIEQSERGTIFTISLNFNLEVFPDEAIATGYQNQIILRRGAIAYTQNTIGGTSENFEHFKRFSDMSTSDADLSLLGTLEEVDKVRVALYAVSYGKVVLDTIYSKPVYLSFVDIPFTQAP